MYRGDFRLVHSVPSRDTTGPCDWSQEALMSYPRIPHTFRVGRELVLRATHPAFPPVPLCSRFRSTVWLRPVPCAVT